LPDLAGLGVSLQQWLAGVQLPAVERPLIADPASLTDRLGEMLAESPAPTGQMMDVLRALELGQVAAAMIGARPVRVPPPATVPRQDGAAAAVREMAATITFESGAIQIVQQPGEPADQLAERVLVGLKGKAARQLGNPSLWAKVQ
jgi:hypothetical protein